MTDTRLDDCLSVRGGHLFVEDVDTLDLVADHGSPLFVVSEDQVRRNVRRFQNSFTKGWPDGPVKILPAAKASWIGAVQRIIADEGCGCDVYSEGELAIALDAGFPPELISVNGVPKAAEHVRRAVEAGVRITIDSREEVAEIERAASELGRVAKVRLRLKPTVSGFTRASDFVPQGLVPTDLAAMVYKGGLTFDEVMAVAPTITGSEAMELVGFHEHHGRHHRSRRYWAEQMKAYAREIGRVCRALDGFQPREIDIGGGFAVPRDPFNAATDYTEPFQLGALFAVSKALEPLGQSRRYGLLARLVDTISASPNRVKAPTIEDYAETCTATLRRALAEEGIRCDGVMLQVEPGRSIHGNSGIHLTTVRALKEVTRPIRWKMVVVDTTEFWFTGGRYEHHLHDYLLANKAGAERAERVDVVGRSCYGDRVLPAVRLPRAEVGDVLAMLDTGAYQEVSMSNFNAIPRPPTILVHGDEAEIVRRRETQDDVLRRDVLPGRLQRAEKRPSRRAS